LHEPPGSAWDLDQPAGDQLIERGEVRGTELAGGTPNDSTQSRNTRVLIAGSSAATSTTASGPANGARPGGRRGQIERVQVGLQLGCGARQRLGDAALKHIFENGSTSRRKRPAGARVAVVRVSHGVRPRRHRRDRRVPADAEQGRR